jgi:acyl-CoA thioester hydrolase
MSESRPLLVELPFKVQTYDTDFAGIVHNMVYIRWLEDLRLQILAEHFPMEEQLAANQGPILVKTEISYQGPLRLFDEPLGRMWVSHLGRVRWQVQAEIALDDRVAATAKQSGYFADLADLRPVRVPEALREQWRRESQSQPG